MLAAPTFRLHLQIQAVLGGVGAGLLMTGAFRGVVTNLRRPRRGLFVRRRPKQRCPRCSGFGIERCHLCRGSGFVERQKPMLDVILCPACVSNRYFNCAMCSGSGKRPSQDMKLMWRPTQQFVQQLSNGVKGILAMLSARAMSS